MAIVFTGSIAAPIMLGNNATTQQLFVVENGIASRVNVIVRSLDLETDNVGALAAVMPLVKVSRATSVSGGITLDKATLTTTQSSDPALVFRSADYTGAAITATPGVNLWQVFAPRAHTIVEQIVSPHRIDGGVEVVPEICATKDLVLRPGQNLLVQVVAAAGTSNAALTKAAHIKCVWEEDSIATFAISGTVTLSGSPVTGAIVTVIEADDESMTNAVLREIITTPAGGTWASSIRTGKVGAAFVQYKSGATYYTAPGSPYLA